MNSRNNFFPLIIALLIALTSCGGGTYGTGGASDVYARVVDSSGEPLSGVVASGVAVGFSSVSDEAGILSLPLNQAFSFAAPVRFSTPDGGGAVRYIPVDIKAPREDPLTITLGAKMSSADQSLGREDGISCTEILDSWRSAVKDHLSGLSEKQFNRIGELLSSQSPSSEASCEATVVELNALVFGLSAG